MKTTSLTGAGGAPSARTSLTGTPGRQSVTGTPGRSSLTGAGGSSGTGVPPGALETSIGESLISVPAEQFGQLLPFIPDTPWTTPTTHVLQSKRGKVFVDSMTQPRNLVVIAQGDPATKTVDQAFLFGGANSDALKTFVQAVRGPMDIVCDDEVAALVVQHHSEARKREEVVHWYERLEDADKVQPEQGSRRLRISEADQIADLVPGWALRTFRTPKDLVAGGTAYVVEIEGRIVAAAYTVDPSVKYERIGAGTVEPYRGRGLGSKVCAKVVRAVADQGRIPCAIIDRRDTAGMRIAEKLGFTQRAVMTTYTTTFKK